MTKIINNKGQVDKIWETVPLELERCKMTHFQDPETIDYFQKVQYLDRMHCISMENFNKYPNLSIQGDFDGDMWSYIELNVLQCNN